MSEPKNAVAYLRTSSSANVGTDKDSDVRQREAIHAYAKLANLNVNVCDNLPLSGPKIDHFLGKTIFSTKAGIPF